MEVIDKEIHINRGDRLLIDFSIDNKGTDYILGQGLLIYTVVPVDDTNISE